MTVTVRRLNESDIAEWQRMRNALWSDVPADELALEMPDWLKADQRAVFVSERPAGGLCGFLEIAIRPCSVTGDLGKFGYIEIWYVDPDMRNLGIGKSLVQAAERWASDQGCEELHSDATMENHLSQSVHVALDFKEVERLVHFRKQLNSE